MGNIRIKMMIFAQSMAMTDDIRFYPLDIFIS
jgi:hypothetical protein